MNQDQVVQVFEALLGIPPRGADLAVIAMLSNRPDVFEAEDVAEYIWDHWLGEPDEPSLEHVVELVKQVAS